MDFSSSSSHYNGPIYERGSNIEAAAAERGCLFPTDNINMSSSSSYYISNRVYDCHNRNYNFNHHNYYSSRSAGGPSSSSSGAKLQLMESSDPNANQLEEPRRHQLGGCANSVEMEIKGTSEDQREHMFDKVVTPSDVGKLNRLVIPKQHAEKYFPLDSSSSEKVLLLNFEDRGGKSWRFRYSYWNSSQSYVMTKGWSRFVKEKKLDAGDIVSFQRGTGERDKDRFYIDWRRRPDHSPDIAYPDTYPILQLQHGSWVGTAPPPFVLRSQPFPQLPVPLHCFTRDHNHHMSQMIMMNMTTTTNFGPNLADHYHQLHPSNTATIRNHHHHPPTTISNSNLFHKGSVFYVRPGPAGGGGRGLQMTQTQAQMKMQMQMQRQMQMRPEDQGHVEGTSSRADLLQPMVFEAVPVVQCGKAPKRLRLFGVNMDCPISSPSHDDDDDDDEDNGHSDCNILSSISMAPPMNNYHHVNAYYASHRHERQYEHISSSPLQLSLYDRAYPSLPMTASTTRARVTPPELIDDKSKSSMSLDFDI